MSFFKLKYLPKKAIEKRKEKKEKKEKVVIFIIFIGCTVQCTVVHKIIQS